MNCNKERQLPNCRIRDAFPFSWIFRKSYLVDGHETDGVGVYGPAGARTQQGRTGMARLDASGLGSAPAEAWAEGR